MAQLSPSLFYISPYNPRIKHSFFLTFLHWFTKLFQHISKKVMNSKFAQRNSIRSLYEYSICVHITWQQWIIQNHTEAMLTMNNGTHRETNLTLKIIFIKLAPYCKQNYEILWKAKLGNWRIICRYSLIRPNFCGAEQHQHVALHVRYVTCVCRKNLCNVELCRTSL